MTQISRLCIGGPMDGKILATMDDVGPVFQTSDGSLMRYEKCTLRVWHHPMIRPFMQLKTGYYNLFIAEGPLSNKVIAGAIKKARIEIKSIMEEFMPQPPKN